MIYLADKAPSPENVDYNLDMRPFIPEGYSIDDVTVEVTAAGNGESPIALSSHDVSTQTIEGGGDDLVAILFWLSGGTPGVRYRGVITMSDTESAGVTDRTYARAFEVEVKDL